MNCFRAFPNCLLHRALVDVDGAGWWDAKGYQNTSRIFILKRTVSIIKITPARANETRACFNEGMFMSWGCFVFENCTLNYVPLGVKFRR